MAAEGKTLVLAEKPSVAREYARVLGGTKKTPGYMEGGGYVVSWALGHLVTLAEPEAYDPRYKQWRMEDLPMIPDTMKLKVIGKTSRQFRTIRDLLNRPDIKRIIIATDAGREGELVARWIIKLSGARKPMQRLWISSQTDAALKTGFRSLRPAKEYERLFHAAVCRAEADWLIGLNVSRALTCHFDTSLTAGRVQTPTLWMMVKREAEIREFIPKPYWTLHADLEGFSCQRQTAAGNPRIMDQSKAQAMIQSLEGQPARVEDVRQDNRSEPPPRAYDLTALQRDANNRFGFSAKQTLSIMQRLYESHKLLTYPRTDSRYITRDMVPTLGDRLKSLPEKHFGRWTRSLKGKTLNPGSWLVDDSKVSDHHAILPTEIPARVDRLSPEEWKIYELVARRFLAVLYPPFRYRRIRVRIRLGEEEFIASGRTVLDPGWQAVSAPQRSETTETPDKLTDQNLPELKKGMELKVKSLRLKSAKTRPPSRFTEATLLAAMENPASWVADEKIKQALKEAGLGTPATRAEIIEKLLSHEYIERQGRQLIPTGKGIQLVGLVPDTLCSPALTAQWEQELASIATGKSEVSTFMKEIRDHTRKLISSIKASTATYTHQNVTRTPCPQCKKPMLKKKVDGEPYLVCQDRSCGHQQPEAPVLAEEFRPGGHRRKRRSSKHLIERYTDANRSAGTLGDLLDSALEKPDKQ